MDINMNEVELLAKMENVLDIPSNERLTIWYGDYGLYEPKSNITQDMIHARIEELDKAIQHNDSIYIEVKETLSRIIKIENPSSVREALETVEQQYRESKIILDAEDLQDVEFRQWDEAIDEVMEAANDEIIDYDIEM